MDSVILEYAICKWADRETASYLPINSINEHQTVDGKTVNMIFDAWGRQLGVPTFNYPRPPYEEDLRPSDDIKYYRFDPDDERKVVVYRMTGYTKVLPSGGGGGGGGGGTPSNALTSNTEFSTTAGNYTFTFTSNGGIQLNGVSFVPQMVVSTNTTDTSAYIPVLSGGVCYKFEQPLTVLSIGQIQSSMQETDILFTAGAVVSHPATVYLKYQNGDNGYYAWDEIEGEQWFSNPSYIDFPLISSGTNRYEYIVPNGGIELCSFEVEEWNEGVGDTITNSYGGILSGGSFTCTSANGKWVISAHNVVEYYYHTEYPDLINENRTINDWVASSTDDMTTWVVNDEDATLIIGWHLDETGETKFEDVPPIVNGARTVTPCDVVLPSGALLVNSNAIKTDSGYKYEMNVKYGAIATGNWQVKK